MVDSSPGMIVDVDIENFRCFRKVELRDLRRFVVVVGANGSGKSALLEAIFILLGSGPDKVLSVRAGRALHYAESPSFAALWDDLFFGFDLESTVALRERDDRQGSRELSIGWDRDPPVNMLFRDGSISGRLRHMAFVYSINGAPQEKILAKVTGEGISSGVASSEYPNDFISQVGQASARHNVTTRFSELSQRGRTEGIVKAVSSLFPEVQDLRVEIYGGRPRIFVKSAGIARLFPIDLLSAGITGLVNILISIEFLEHGAVLIDEVDAGLHHSILRQSFEVMANFARERDVQLIFTTHSAEFLSKIAPITAASGDEFCLVRTERRGGETIVKQFDGESLDAALQEHVEIR